jgi:hypothetical protein
LILSSSQRSKSRMKFSKPSLSKVFNILKIA